MVGVTGSIPVVPTILRELRLGKPTLIIVAKRAKPRQRATGSLQSVVREPAGLGARADAPVLERVQIKQN